jgi:hypothetical protein
VNEFGSAQAVTLILVGMPIVFLLLFVYVLGARWARVWSLTMPARQEPSRLRCLRCAGHPRADCRCRGAGNCDHGRHVHNRGHHRPLQDDGHQPMIEALRGLLAGVPESAAMSGLGSSTDGAKGTEVCLFACPVQAPVRPLSGVLHPYGLSARGRTGPLGPTPGFQPTEIRCILRANVGLTRSLLARGGGSLNHAHFRREIEGNSAGAAVQF